LQKVAVVHSCNNLLRHSGYFWIASGLLGGVGNTDPADVLCGLNGKRDLATSLGLQAAVSELTARHG